MTAKSPTSANDPKVVLEGPLALPSGAACEDPLDAEVSPLRFGPLGEDAAPESNTREQPSERLRTAHLQPQEFSEVEATTARTEPPGSWSSSTNQGFETQPIDRHILQRLDGVSAGEVIALNQLPASIGRHPSCTVCVDDAGVSRNHANVSKIEGALVIEDLASRNGTFIEGTRITRKKLTEGCLLQIGLHVAFRYAVVDERQEQVLRQLFRSSTRDALTGVYNRRHFDDRLTAEFAYAKRHSADLSLVIIDVDHFKQVNDTFGHMAGDAVLRQIAGTLQQQLRVEDVLSRVGGEEFAVILRGIGSVGAARLGERLRAAVERSPSVLGGQAHPTTISAGCATLAELTSPSAQTLFSTADHRLYAAKRSGRNRVVSQD